LQEANRMTARTAVNMDLKFFIFFALMEFRKKD